MIIDTLNRLKDSGELDELLSVGYFRSTVPKKMRVFLFFNKEMLTSVDKVTSITYTAERLKVSERYVYKVIAEMTALIKIKPTMKKKRSKSFN